MRALSLFLALFLGAAGVAAGADANHRRLAEHYAPVAVDGAQRGTVVSARIAATDGKRLSAHALRAAARPSAATARPASSARSCR